MEDETDTAQDFDGAREYDTAELSKATGVTSRTLRHYDEIGLLTPAWTGNDGRRHYGEAELLRLQHILVLRSLGTSLDTIAAIVDTDDQSLVASLLRDHHRALLAERERYARLAATVERTITLLEHGLPLTPADLFEGFDHEQYLPEARERWGADRVDESTEKWRAMSPDAQRRQMAEHEAIARAAAALAASGASPDSDQAQALVARHYAWVSMFWTPSAEAYEGLGRLYVDDHRFRSNYDKFGDGTAEFLREAIAQHAASMD